MKPFNRTEILFSLVALALAAAAPNAFPLAQAGYGSLRDLALSLIVPAAALLVLWWWVSRAAGQTRLARRILCGAIAGAVATLALEAVRYPAFRLGFMPGNMPDLMGVLLLDRFAQGPSLASTVAGCAYHFWNGASFGVIFAVLAGTRRPLWWALLYAELIGIGFMVSPVVQSLGVGRFGIDFAWQFAATVVTAHLAYGAALEGLLSACSHRRLATPPEPGNPAAASLPDL